MTDILPRNEIAFGEQAAPPDRRKIRLPVSLALDIENYTMTNLKSLVLIAIVCLFATGCGTVLSQHIYHKNGKAEYENKEQYERVTCGIGQPSVYSGVAFDFRALLAPFICDGGEGGLAYIAYYPILAPLLVVDLPLSLTADTIILPYTTYKQIKYGSMVELKKKSN